MVATLRRAALAILTLWIGIVIVGPEIDKKCVEGKFSVEQAEAVNNLPWGKCPKYRNGDCHIEAGDRMLAGECSTLSRSFFLQNHISYVRKFWRKYGSQSEENTEVHVLQREGGGEPEGTPDASPGEWCSAVCGEWLSCGSDEDSSRSEK